MEDYKIPLFSIIDIIHLNRDKTKLKTVNKSCFVISCRLNGECLFQYNNENITVKKGELLYIPKGCNYTQECEKEEIICFHLESYSDIDCIFSVYKSQNPGEIVNLFTKAYYTWKTKEPNYRYVCMAYLYKILAMFNVNFAEQKNPFNKYINSSLLYLENHIYDCDLTIESLCKNTNISRSYFNKFFKEKYAITPIAYINKKRIEKAKYLLESRNYTNEEIAYICGFNDVKYFYIVFRKSTNMTTGEWIKRSIESD